MLNLILLEFMKWKRSRILLGALAAILIGPFTAAVSAYAKSQNPQQLADWDTFFAITLQINLSLLFPILFGALTAYVFVQEYHDRTIINLLTLPQKRTHIFLAKLLTLLATLMTLILLSLFFTFIGGKIMLPSSLSLEAFLKLARLSVVTGVMVLCFIPVFSYIAIKTRTFIPPLVGATGFTLLNFAALVSPTYGPLVPTSIPVFYLLNAIGWKSSLPFTWSILLPIFAGFLSLCFKEYLTQEIC